MLSCNVCFITRQPPSGCFSWQFYCLANFFCLALHSFHLSTDTLVTLSRFFSLTTVWPFITQQWILMYFIKFYIFNCTLYSYNNGKHWGTDIAAVIRLHNGIVFCVRIFTTSKNGIASRPGNKVSKYYVTNYLV